MSDLAKSLLGYRYEFEQFALKGAIRIRQLGIVSALLVRCAHLCTEPRHASLALRLRVGILKHSG